MTAIVFRTAQVSTVRTPPPTSPSMVVSTAGEGRIQVHHIQAGRAGCCKGARQIGRMVGQAACFTCAW